MTISIGKPAAATPQTELKAATARAAAAPVSNPLFSRAEEETNADSFDNDVKDFKHLGKKDSGIAQDARDAAVYRVTTAYNNFQIEHPDTKLKLDEMLDKMPDPKDYEKKRNGLNNYTKALERWENTHLNIIEKNSNKTMVEQVKENTDKSLGRAAIFVSEEIATSTDYLSQKIGKAEEVLSEKVDKTKEELTEGFTEIVNADGKKTRAVVNRSAEKILEETRLQGGLTRLVNSLEEEETREVLTKTVVTDGDKTRNALDAAEQNVLKAVDDQGDGTREALCEEISAASNKLNKEINKPRIPVLNIPLDRLKPRIPVLNTPLNIFWPTK
jgi:hypothetical protein